MMSEDTWATKPDTGAQAILYFATTLGIAVSISFIGLGLFPDRLSMDDMPIILRLIVGLFGALMFLCCLAAIRHLSRVRQALRDAPVVPDHVEVEVDNGSDSTSYTLIAKLGDEIWAVPAYAGKGIALIKQGAAHDIRAWRDRKTGAPIAFRVDGNHIETHPRATQR